MVVNSIATATDVKRALNTPAVAIRSMGKKGKGVVAEKALPAMTFVATYPGDLLSMTQYSKRLQQGLTDGKFAVAFYKPAASGARTNYVLDPGMAGGLLQPRHAQAVAPLVNEPGVRGSPNLMWVWNLPLHRLEFWTLRAVSAGEELTACYGTGGDYQRSYRTACVARQDEVEPQLHVVTRRGGKPVPYSSLGTAGVNRVLTARKR